MPAPFPHRLIDDLLSEDVPDIDLTTAALGIGARLGRMAFHARGDLVVAGLDVAAELIGRCGVEVTVTAKAGASVSAGTHLLTATGDAAGLHASWKVAQTLTEYLCGVATRTRALVNAVEAVNPAVRVAATRKTPPLARKLYLAAIRAGGAVPHRTGLSETVLVFAEHLAFLGGASLLELAQNLRAQAPEKKIGIEVKSMESAGEAVAAGFDLVQLEKMSPQEVAAVAEMARSIPHPPMIAAAGGITAANAPQYVAAGAGLIVTSWPYSAPPAEVAVTLMPIG